MKNISTTVGRRLGKRKALAAAVTGAIALAVVVSGCTTVSSGSGTSSFSGTGSAVNSITGQSDADIAKIVAGRTITVGYVPPILSEYYTQVEKAAWNQMDEYS